MTLQRDVARRVLEQADQDQARRERTPARMADALDALERYGLATDLPEGARFVSLSHTLARDVAAALRSVAAGGSLSPVLSHTPRGELVARVAGDVFTRAAVSTDDCYKQLADQTRAVEWSVRIARQIVGEVERTEQGGANDDAKA